MFFSRFWTGNTNSCQSPKTGFESVTFVDSLTPVSGIGISTHRGIKNAHKNLLPGNGNQNQNVDDWGDSGCLISLPILLLCAIIALAIISRIIRLISPHPQTIKNSPKFSANFLHLLWVSFGDGGNIAFLKFSLIFSLKRFLHYVPYGTYGTFWKSIWT